MSINGSDVFLQQLLGSSLGAAWGADPRGNFLMPGPTSHLSGRMQGRFAASGVPWMAGYFPTPMFSSQISSLQGGFPPMLQQGGFGGGPAFSFFG